MRSVLAVLLLTGLVSACGADPAASPEPLPPSTAAPVSAPSGSPSPSAPPTAPAPSTATELRPVYWLGTDDRRPVLYREFVPRPATGDDVRDALELMLAGDPRDPDYTSLWAPGTRLRDVGRNGARAVVDLSAEARRNGGGSEFEAMTLQQLVHTVTAADPSLTSVQLLVDGRPVETLWGSADASEPLVRGPQEEVLAPVWLDVQQGGVLEDGRFGGTATVFEATVSWSLARGGEVVEEGFSTASIGAPGRGEWSAQADVPPGDYELRAWESSAEDGSVTWLDTKAVTVR